MRFIISLLALAFTSSLFATALPNADVAVTLSGTILDAEFGVPLEYATVSAFDADEALINGASTDSLGRFSMTLPKGEYALRFEFIGYARLDSSLSLKQNTDLGSIRLQTDAVALDGATVTAQRSQMTLKLDKQIFDVGADVLAQGGSANDVLDNVPSINVSPEGVVSLRGNSGVKILINGKPSTLADNNALQSLDAANIASVEIMTQPSARYEASGSGGIINIVMKEKTEKSWGGQVSASVGIPDDYRLNGSFSVSEKKWTYYGNAGARYSKYFSNGEADRISNLASGVELLREDLEQERSDKAWNGFGGFDYRITDKTTLSASYSHYYQLDDDVSDVVFKYSDENGTLSRELKQTLGYREPGKYNQIEASLSHDLKKKDQKIFVLFQNDFWRSPEKETMKFYETLSSGQATLDIETESIESSTDYLLQVDYEQPVGEHAKLEFGIRGEARVIESDYIAERIDNGERSVYLGFDNQLDYFERIGAGYVQYGYEHNDWGLQVGLRDEYTYVRVEQKNGDPDILKEYNNLFPSATISRKINEKWSSNFGYSKRIRRPGFWFINPFGGLSNPNSIELGNADIDPSRVDAFELKVLYASEKLTVNPFVSMSYVHGFYDRFATQDSTGLVRLLIINLDVEKQMAAGATISYSPTKDWQFNGEIYVAKFTQIGEYEGIDFGNDFNTAYIQLSARGLLFKGIRGQLTFDYNGGQRYAQFYRDPNYGLRGGLTRKFLDDRLQLSLNVRNMFELQQYAGGSQRATFTNSYRRQWTGQRVQLTAAWDLGKQMRMRRARGSIR
ncbi:MAG: TonB-dependent receptor [Saprospiraceae bacterium]